MTSTAVDDQFAPDPEVRTVHFVAPSISEARSMWMRWAEAQREEPYFVGAEVHRAGGLVEWTVRYLPEAPVEAFGGADMHLPDWNTVPVEMKRMRGPFCAAASGLFSNGGRLADYGLTFKPGVDATRAVRLLRALLGSFGPKHEHKIGGVAFLLSQWCDHPEAKP